MSAERAEYRMRAKHADELVRRLTLPDERQRRTDRHMFIGLVIAALVSVAWAWLS